MSKYAKFIFNSYEFNQDEKQLKLSYSYDNDLEFYETYRFDFTFTDYNPEGLDRALQLLFFIAGVSYYKMYLAPEIVIESSQVDSQFASFLSKTYQKGLGEFFYVNELDPLTPVNFPTNSDPFDATEINCNGGKLIGIGGGKDSLVSVELLKDQEPVSTWSLNHRTQLEPLINRIGLPHLWVDRNLDPKLLELNKQGALNGHIPISAIFSCVGTVVSILAGYQDNIVSNESSASEPNLSYNGVDINHQYSKSLEYEKDYQALLEHYFGQSLRYYSFLRPLSELRISEIFADIGFNKYKDVFSSCNRAFTHDQHKLFWCGECPKCAFIFLALTPFLDRAALEELWHGKNLLLDPSLEPTYRQLLGIEGDKPLECVGEVKEARAAMRLAQKIYPELNKYKFDLPDDYDYKSWSIHSMPEKVLILLKSKLGT